MDHVSEKNRSLSLTAAKENEVQEVFEEVDELKQGLKQRHIQMIALAGTIGTGLFLSSGRAIANSGPLGAFLGFSIIGLSVSSVIMGVGELGALVPLSGGIVRYSEYFFDPALAFANGWNEAYGFLIAVPAEIVATAVLIEFWVTINNAVWITLFGALMLISSYLFVGIYGELEFIFSTLKILLIVGVNIMALVITCGGANGVSIGFRYWRNPGPFVQKFGIPGSLGQFLAFWSELNSALYSFSGIENITLAAAETRNPRRAIPMAARRIFWRILIFYVLSIFMIGLVVPSNDPDLLRSTGTAAQSPFVIAANRASINVVPSIINAVVLTSAWSSGNSNVLSGSRILYGMAAHGHAPKILMRLNRFRVPWIAITVFGLFMCLGYMTLQDTASTIFTWLQDLVSISTLVNWICICLTYLRFFYGCKRQGINRQKELPWAAPFQPYTTWASLGLFIVLLLTGGYSTFMRRHWNTETFVSSYINIPLVLMLYFGYKYWKGTRFVRLDEMPIRAFVEQAWANPEPAPKPKRGLQKINFLWG